MVIFLFPAIELYTYNSIVENQVSNREKKSCLQNYAGFLSFFLSVFLSLCRVNIVYLPIHFFFLPGNIGKIISSTFLASRCGPHNQFWPVECRRSDVPFSQTDPTQKAPQV